MKQKPVVLGAAVAAFVLGASSSHWLKPAHAAMEIIQPATGAAAMQQCNFDMTIMVWRDLIYCVKR